MHPLDSLVWFNSSAVPNRDACLKGTLINISTTSGDQQSIIPWDPLSWKSFDVVSFTRWRFAHGGRA